MIINLGFSFLFSKIQTIKPLTLERLFLFNIFDGMSIISYIVT